MIDIPLKTKAGISTRMEGKVCLDSDWMSDGVTAQFMDNAETYHERYYDNDSWKNLIQRAFESAHVDQNASLKVLDIGSGSGNTVFAATELLPKAKIYASDISPQLLQIMMRIQERIPSLEGRIEAYCFDLHKDFFCDDSFDMVIGGAILHHMLDPQAALKNVARWLRPGGKIYLFEPLEVGAHIMSAIYLTLLGELEQEKDVDPRLLSFFKAMCYDYEARYGVPRIKPWTHVLDDKWMFHQSYLRDMASKIGLVLETVVPTVTDTEMLFSNSVRSTLSLAGLGAVATPNSLWKVLKEFDQGIAPELKNKLTLEGIIILAKPSLEQACAQTIK